MVNLMIALTGSGKIPGSVDAWCLNIYTLYIEIDNSQLVEN
jgi:hypothetical protein